MFNGLVKCLEMITGNGGIHVVLGVVVHMPVEKLQERVHGERPAAETEIGGFVHQTDMLGSIAGEEKRTPEEMPPAENHGNHPPSAVKADQRDGSVAEKSETRKVDHPLTGFEILRKQGLFPFSGELATGKPSCLPQDSGNLREVNDSMNQEVFDPSGLRQGDF